MEVLEKKGILKNRTDQNDVRIHRWYSDSAGKNHPKHQEYSRRKKKSSGRRLSKIIFINYYPNNW